MAHTMWHTIGEFSKKAVYLPEDTLPTERMSCYSDARDSLSSHIYLCCLPLLIKQTPLVDSPDIGLQLPSTPSGSRDQNGTIAHGARTESAKAHTHAIHIDFDHDFAKTSLA